MPSDAKKKQQQKKKEAAKARQSGKKPQGTSQKASEQDGQDVNAFNGDDDNVSNGTNGVEISAEGIMTLTFIVLKEAFFNHTFHSIMPRNCFFFFL